MLFFLWYSTPKALFIIYLANPLLMGYEFLCSCVEHSYGRTLTTTFAKKLVTLNYARKKKKCAPGYLHNWQLCTSAIISVGISAQNLAHSGSWDAQVSVSTADRDSGWNATCGFRVLTLHIKVRSQTARLLWKRLCLKLKTGDWTHWNEWLTEFPTLQLTCEAV